MCRTPQGKVHNSWRPIWYQEASGKERIRNLTPRSARKTKEVCDPSSSNHPEDSLEEQIVKRISARKNGRHSMGVKLVNYDGNTCLDLSWNIWKLCGILRVGRFGQPVSTGASLVGAVGQILWDAGKQTTVSRIVVLLKARFGSENQAERFRAELRSRKRSKRESLQKHYQDVCRLISLAYPDESSTLSEIVGRDAFFEILDDQALRVRILEKEPKIWMTLLIWRADWKRSV